MEAFDTDKLGMYKMGFKNMESWELDSIKNNNKNKASSFVGRIDWSSRINKQMRIVKSLGFDLESL